VHRQFQQKPSAKLLSWSLFNQFGPSRIFHTEYIPLQGRQNLLDSRPEYSSNQKVGFFMREFLMYIHVYT
jgi:hypothetical protein